MAEEGRRDRQDQAPTKRQALEPVFVMAKWCTGDFFSKANIVKDTSVKQ